MDDKKEDIYSSPDRSRKQDDDLPDVDLQTAVARNQARRRSIGVTVFMIVVLLIAIWSFIALQNKRKESVEALIEKAGTELIDPRDKGSESDGTESLKPTAVAPSLENIADQIRAPQYKALSSMDRERLARAMGEVRIASQYLKDKDWDLAEEHALKALDLWEDMTAAMRVLGFVYIQRGQMVEAVGLLEKVLSLEPFSSETYNNLASAYIQNWNLPRAEELLRTSLDINPDFLAAHINLGLLYVIAGRYEQTITHLDQAVNLAPDNAPARNNLSVALLRVGRYSDAREHMDYLLEKFPERPKTYFNKAITYVLERNAAEAMRWIEQGAQHCTPITCRSYLSDSDFDPLRSHPDFKSFLEGLFPELPRLPGE